MEAGFGMNELCFLLLLDRQIDGWIDRVEGIREHII